MMGTTLPFEHHHANPEPAMIVKAIPKAGGIFIPAFPFTGSNRQEELTLNVEAVNSEQSCGCNHSGHLIY
jgi:hypothetical protein